MTRTKVHVFHIGENSGEGSGIVVIHSTTLVLQMQIIKMSFISMADFNINQKIEQMKKFRN